MEEFKAFVTGLDYYTDCDFGEKDINTAFLNSQFVCINEIGNDEIFEMNFLEFLEAIVRVTNEIRP